MGRASAPAASVPMKHPFTAVPEALTVKPAPGEPPMASPRMMLFPALKPILSVGEEPAALPSISIARTALVPSGSVLTLVPGCE